LELSQELDSTNTCKYVFFFFGVSITLGLVPLLHGIDANCLLVMLSILEIPNRSVNSCSSSKDEESCEEDENIAGIQSNRIANNYNKCNINVGIKDKMIDFTMSH
jgi:hypothetical protein